MQKPEDEKEDSQKQLNDKEVFEKIYNNYNNLNQMMVEEMKLSSKHNGITGSYREEMWVKFFRSILPQKFSLAQGVMIIDSYGLVSKEVDIAVFDEQYTPYVFQYNTLKFIPIEAVALVVECKSTSLPTKSLIKWADCIDKLCPRSSGIARMVNGYVTGLTNYTQERTRPIKILASLKKSTEERPLESIKKGLGEYFDFIIQETGNENKGCFKLIVKHADKNLAWWGKRLNTGNLSDTCDQGIALELLSKKLIEEDDPVKIKGKVEEWKEKLKSSPELKVELGQDSKTFWLKNTLRELEVAGNPFLSLNLQLNQLLMLINNPMLFPHYAYAKRFNDIAAAINREEENKTDC